MSEVSLQRFRGLFSVSYQEGIDFGRQLVQVSPGNTSVHAATERRGNNLRGFEDIYLEAKARIWPRLSYMYHIRSAAGKHIECESPFRYRMGTGVPRS